MNRRSFLGLFALAWPAYKLAPMLAPAPAKVVLKPTDPIYEIFIPTEQRVITTTFEAWPNASGRWIPLFGETEDKKIVMTDEFKAVQKNGQIPNPYQLRGRGTFYSLSPEDGIRKADTNYG